MKKTDCNWMKDGLCFWFTKEGEVRDCEGCLEYDPVKPSREPIRFIITIEGRMDAEFESDIEEDLKVDLAPLFEKCDVEKVDIIFPASKSGTVLKHLSKLPGTKVKTISESELKEMFRAKDEHRKEFEKEED